MKILILCLGNICRSPLAEGILRAKLPKSFEIDSAGTISFHEGGKADKRSIETAKRHGVDISGHRARVITSEDFSKFDKIYCMDVHNLQDAYSMTQNEDERQKIEMMMPDGSEVPDPYYEDLGAFERVYEMLDKACNERADELTLGK